MKFEIEHHFDALPVDLLAVMHHPRLPEALMAHMENLIEMEILMAEGEKRQVRYRPEPMIKRIGPKKVEARWMEWVEHSTTDKSQFRVDFENIPRLDSVARLMLNRGTIYIRRSGSGSARTLEGELKIKVPFLGRIAENMIYKHATGLLDEEARVTADIIAAGGVDAFLG